jgi:polygalacturonase
MRRYDTLSNLRQFDNKSVNVTLIPEKVNLQPGYSSSYVELDNGLIRNLTIKNKHG